MNNVHFTLWNEWMDRINRLNGIVLYSIRGLRLQNFQFFSILNQIWDLMIDDYELFYMKYICEMVKTFLQQFVVPLCSVFGWATMMICVPLKNETSHKILSTNFTWDQNIKRKFTMCCKKLKTVKKTFTSSLRITTSTTTWLSQWGREGQLGRDSNESKRVNFMLSHVQNQRKNIALILTAFHNCNSLSPSGSLKFTSNRRCTVDTNRPKIPYAPLRDSFAFRVVRWSQGRKGRLTSWRDPILCPACCRPCRAALGRC